MSRRDLAPWQSWWVDFDPQVGREQAGLRPAIVVGTAFACQLPNDLVLLVPCTTTDRGLPFQPRISSFKRPTFALCEQVKSVSRERLRRQIAVSIAEEDVAIIKFVLRQLVATN